MAKRPEVRWLSGALVLALAAVVLTVGATWPIKPNQHENYPVACSRSLVTTNANLALFEYAAFGPINACMSADFRSFVSQLAPVVRLVKIPTVTLQLNSSGGSFADVLAMAEAIRHLKKAGFTVRVIASGQVRGAALWLFALADERYIADEALVAFEYPYEQPRRGIWPVRQAIDERHRVWLEMVANGLEISLNQLEALFDQRAVLYGYEVAQRGWARSTRDLEVLVAVPLPWQPDTPETPKQP